MKKIKWENITFIVFIILGCIAIYQHSMNANSLTILEFPFYFGQAVVCRYAVKYSRKNFKEFSNDLKSLFED